MWWKRGSDKQPEQRSLVARLQHELDATLSTLPPSLLVLSALTIGSSATLVGAVVYRRFLRRIPNGEWVTPDVLARKRWIKGYVTSVGDNDNFRLYHTPAFGWRWPLKFRRVPIRKNLKGQTIHIRLAGIDAPEAAHFGRPGQPHSAEALEWLKSQVENKFVYCQLVRKDQYGRIVALPHVPRKFIPTWITKGKCVSLEMLKAGWAVTYEQAGAEYGRWGKDTFKALQTEAEKSRQGMWKHGSLAETPAEYKRRHASESVIESEKGSSAEEALEESTPWWRKLLSR
ncbi:SNase-domain-containing protein [Cristinia sonorae]|uniref:SNase-domain-containing protein n=1 Tax=Cristinia sonorae TaxID=1940300 RepID=A0A8K0UHX7_9AGAR|nr:SNase-domain-containing protein [Cristinia sonorae]